MMYTLGNAANADIEKKSMTTEIRKWTRFATNKELKDVAENGDLYRAEAEHELSRRKRRNK